MNTRVIAAASAVAVTTVLAGAASAASGGSRSLSFTDYTPDPATLAATEALYVGTGMQAQSWCGGRVPAAPQDVNAHRLVVTKSSQLDVQLNATGAWGIEVDNRLGTAIRGAASDRTPASPVVLQLRLAPGTYFITACNLGGAPTAQATFRLASTR